MPRALKTRIVLLGPPACGKGTQAVKIQARYGIPSVSPGAMLRDEIRRGTPLGLEADQITRDGDMAPDAMVLGLVEKWLETRCSQFVFDGFPRTLVQAEAFDAILARQGQTLDAVLYFDLSFEAISGRVLNRLTCGQCGHIARATEVASGSDCPVCGGKLVRRDDDTPEALRQRMAQYHEKTDPLTGYYQAKGLLFQLDAEAAPDAVFRQIEGILES